MPQQYPFIFTNVSLTGLATAVSVLSLIQNASVGSVQPTGSCVSLNIKFSSDTYWGNSSAVTNANGALLPANTPLTDLAVGALSDTIPIASMFAYSVAGASGVVYARFIP